MNFQNLSIIFQAALHCPIAWWTVAALFIAVIFMGKDPVFKENRKCN
jgi:hypothetical protein